MPKKINNTTEGTCIFFDKILKKYDAIIIPENNTKA